MLTCKLVASTRNWICTTVASLALAVAVGAEAASAQSAAASITAGTSISAQLNGAVSTKASRVGEKVEATLVKGAKHNGAVVLPKGSLLRGTITAVRSADPKRKVAAHLKMEFSEVILPDGRTLPAKASTEETGWGELYPCRKRMLATVTVTGALLGAGIGGLAGGRSGAVVGVAIGGGLNAVIVVPCVALRWHEIELRKGSPIFVLFNQDFEPPPSAQRKP